METFRTTNTSHQLMLHNWVSKYPNVTAGFTTRLGGYSSVPYESFNIGLHVGDDANAVIRNREKLASSVGFEFDAWTSAEQVHSNVVVKVEEMHKGRGRLSMSDTLAGADGLVTNVPGILLTSFYADCVPLYFYDPIQQVIGLAHAGWRGTVSAIAQETVNEMQKHYNSRPEHILAAIGPAIDACCYEVDHTVIARIHDIWSQLNLSEMTLNEVIKPNFNEKAFINLKEINRQIMIKAGILPSHIELSNWCTGCRTDMFFSHRAENGKTGRMASWIGLT